MTDWYTKLTIHIEASKTNTTKFANVIQERRWPALLYGQNTYCMVPWICDEGLPGCIQYSQGEEYYNHRFSPQRQQPAEAFKNYTCQQQRHHLSEHQKDMDTYMFFLTYKYNKQVQTSTEVPACSLSIC